MQNKKKDFYLVAIIGFLVGWLVLMPIKNFGYEIKPLLILISVVGLTLFAPLALFILKFLGKFWPVLEQFGKFAAVGTLNTLLYLAVINLLILLTDIAKGTYYSVFVVVGYLVSTTNSYVWNKFWTFQNRSPATFAEYGRFAFFTFIGILLNASTASLIVNVIGAPVGVNLKLWANVGALVAVAVTLFWNFSTYRRFVFKPK
jgi:putative flippase GtrA